MKIRSIDHVGIIVNNLPVVQAFFLDLGLEKIGVEKVEGEWMVRMKELHDVKEEVVTLEIAMLQAVDGEANIELVKFHTASDKNDIKYPLSNTLGIRHIAFAVEDIDAIVTKLKKKGAELMGEIQTFENAYKLCFVRGPEGIILELAENIK
ncbi:glyoxalase [Sporosarcina sp. P13]|uniref:VOC family protein n=1 Tax=Sporosarcina sp. P13 TaxID=2048263 RepID=UPI000C16467B|nr:VOC family protein [Sporosarcina sp. P13]PIC63628.1 glyoxalase [Sporosarcina sp. P13]